METYLFIGLGSNMGNRKANLAQAVDKINQHIGQIAAQSGIFETPTWGFEAETPFYNQVVRVATKLRPTEVLSRLLEIEAQLGRQRKAGGYSSRPIDLDILFYGSEIINTQTLTLPHPQLHNRRFVLEPLCQMAPDFEHPVLHKTIGELRLLCPDASDCKWIG